MPIASAEAVAETMRGWAQRWRITCGYMRRSAWSWTWTTALWIWWMRGMTWRCAYGAVRVPGVYGVGAAAALAFERPAGWTACATQPVPGK